METVTSLRAMLHLKFTADAQLQLIVAMLGCGLSVARAPFFFFKINLHFDVKFSNHVEL